ncbi:hypothetical protein ACM0CQ_15805 [Mycobacteroides abscessus subsp. abscessus]|uniref:hypothetical protein n=1 Tax=Mycobacteroides abscessus TaxID=36809 RepID=UPI0039EE707E
MTVPAVAPVAFVDAQIAAVQDRALSEGAWTSLIVLYEAAVRARHCGRDIQTDTWLADHTDPLVQAAMQETALSQKNLAAGWVDEHWDWVQDAGLMLHTLDTVAGPAPVGVPRAMIAYRLVAQVFAYTVGENCAGVAWAGGAAVARADRLCGHGVSLRALCAADRPLEAARRELDTDSKVRIQRWVARRWFAIDTIVRELL